MLTAEGHIRHIRYDRSYSRFLPVSQVFRVFQGSARKVEFPLFVTHHDCLETTGTIKNGFSIAQQQLHDAAHCIERDGRRRATPSYTCTSKYHCQTHLTESNRGGSEDQTNHVSSNQFLCHELISSSFPTDSVIRDRCSRLCEI